MAAPSHRDSGAGTATINTSLGPGYTAVVGDLILIHILADGVPSAAPAFSSAIGSIASINGTAGAVTTVFSGLVVGTTEARHYCFAARATAAGLTAVSFTVDGTVDHFGIIHAFTGVAGGSALSDIIENGTSLYGNGGNTGTTVSANGVVTQGPDRLAINLIAINDDNTLASFTGESGGDWTIPTGGSFTSATGTDGALHIQTAAMASQGTIVNGSATMAASDAWGVVGFALKPTSITKSFADTVTVTDFFPKIATPAVAEERFRVASQEDDGSLLYVNPDYSESAENALQSEYTIDGSTFLSETYARWDTSGIPDSATITSAKFRIKPTSVFNATSGMNLAGDWYDYGGDPPTSADHLGATTSAGTAFTQALSGITTGSFIDLTLSGYASGVSKTGYTGLRLRVAGSPGLGDTNLVYSDGYATGYPMELHVRYSLATGNSLTKDLADTVTVSDAVVKAIMLGKADTVTLSDAISRVWAILRAFADTVTLSDAAGKAVAKPVSDSVTLSDAVSKRPALAKAETITVSDASTKAVGLGKADTVTVSDAIGKLMGKPFSDTVTLSDAMTAIKLLVLQLSDTINVSDAIVKAFAAGKTDSITVSDAVVKAPALAKADTITVTDAISKRPTLAKSDSVSVTDAISKAIGLRKTDTVTVTDAFGRTWVIARSFADTITLSDNTAKAFGLAKGDTITLSDAANPLLNGGGIARTLDLADTITLTDAIGKAVVLAKVDVITLSDAVAKGVTTSRADTITLTDAVAKRASLAKADSVTLTDALSKSYATVMADTIAVTDALAKSAGVALADVVSIDEAFNILLNGQSPWEKLGRSRSINIRYPGIY
jgi:hypothetical protein